MAHERHDVAFVVGALLGGLAGATYTLFNAPQAGSQTRAQLAEQLNGLNGQLGTATAKLGEQGERLGQRATATVAALTERVTGDAAVVDAATARTAEQKTEPVLLLPDPLEPAPVVGVEPSPTAADVAAGTATVGGLPAGDNFDVVIDGPRPAGADR